MKKVLVFDMDGTIADLYGVPNWLECLRNESPRPYREALPFYDTTTLNSLLLALKQQGWHIVVTTWLSMEGTRKYAEKVRYQKAKWLKKHGFPYDDLHIIKYGVDKGKFSEKLGGFQIIVDDNEEILETWKLGGTINAQYNIVPKLQALLV